ncbi:MBL fold metallo-hydrolase [Chloroflexota bacterium]
MIIKWLGHATFLITTAKGKHIITDPYQPDTRLKYAAITETAEIVTVSHGHTDHANTATVVGHPQIIMGTSQAHGINFKAVATAHDHAGGAKRGPNTIICFEADGLNICHLGDLGHALSAAEIVQIGRVDVLLMPVGGYYTIGAAEATKIYQDISPGITIPMHFANEKCLFPIAGVDEFLKDKTGVTVTGRSEVNVTKNALPPQPTIMVLSPAK